MIELEEFINKRYEKRVILNNLSFKVLRYEIAVLLGSNRVGKTAAPI